MSERATSHVFIVGAARSGTSLLRRLLNRSSRIAILNETHFFESPRTLKCFIDLCLSRPLHSVPPSIRPASGPLVLPGTSTEYSLVSDWSSDEGARKIVDYLFDNPPHFWKSTVTRVERKEVLLDLLASDRTDKALLQLLMKHFAGDKPILGEKTPGHVHHVPTLMDWFSEAKIIHSVRDPRAVFLSQKQKSLRLNSQRLTRRHRAVRRSKVAYEVYASVNVGIGWLRAMQLDQQFAELYPQRYMNVRYEDIVRAPEEKLREICEFVEVPFEKRMLEHGYQNSSYRNSMETRTVQDESKPFDASAINRWRDLIHPVTKRCIETLTRTQLRRLGYS